MKFAALDFPRRHGAPTTTSPLFEAIVSVGLAGMQTMQPHATDTQPLPRRYRTWLALTGMTQHQFHSVLTQTAHQIPPAAGRPWGLSLPVRLLLVLPHLRTNLTTRALAALFDTSQSTVDRIIHHLVPVLATVLRPDTTDAGQPWIIDGTLIPAHDQSITTTSKNYRRSVNTQIIIGAQHRNVIAVGHCWPGNRNDVIVARSTVAHLLNGTWRLLGDGGYRGIATITSPRRGPDGRIIHDSNYRKHRRIRARVEHAIARPKDWQILRQCRRRGQAIDHSLHIVAGLCNLKTRAQLRVNS